MELYCEKCKRLCVSEKECVCGCEMLREVTSQDYCFLLEANEAFAKMLEECFINNGIDSVLAPSGNGMRSAAGLTLGNFIVYVPYSQYDEAKNIVEFFSETDEVDLRTDIINHKELWNIDKKMKKRFCKKLKLEESDGLFDKISELLDSASAVSDEGRIPYCNQGGHYILVKSGELNFWFNSVTYEILV